MTDLVVEGLPRAIDLRSEAARRRTRRRYRAEARFRAYGIAAILFALAFLIFLIVDIVAKALPAFTVNRLTLDVVASREALDPQGTSDPKVITTGDFMAPVRTALLKYF